VLLPSSKLLLLSLESDSPSTLLSELLDVSSTFGTATRPRAATMETLLLVLDLPTMESAELSIFSSPVLPTTGCLPMPASLDSPELSHPNPGTGSALRAKH
jgi:hypothetical protein